MRASDAWIRRKTIRKSQIFVNTACSSMQKYKSILYWLLFFFFQTMFASCLYDCMCRCIFVECVRDLVCFLLLSGRYKWKSYRKTTLFFLSNSMVNLYVFYGVYMCKTCRFTIFGTTLVLLSFTFLTCFAFVVYHFFTCCPDFKLNQVFTFLSKNQTKRKS